MGDWGWRSWSWLGCPGAVGKPRTGSTPGQGMGQQGLVPPVHLVRCQRVPVPVQEPPVRTYWPPALVAPARMVASAGSRKTTRASPAVAPPAGKVGAQRSASGRVLTCPRHSRVGKTQPSPVVCCEQYPRCHCDPRGFCQCLQPTQSLSPSVLQVRRVRSTSTSV